MLGTCGAEVEGAAGVVLDARFDLDLGAGRADERLGSGHGVEDDRVGGVEDPRGCFGPAHAFVGLGGEHERGAVGSDDLHEASDALAARDR